MDFIIKLLKLKITKIILACMFVVFLASLYFARGWYIKQYHKCVGYYFVHKGDVSYRNKKYQKAVDYYRTALYHYPEHSRASCNLGNIYVSFENYYEAVNAYENALKYSPDFMVCRMDLGIILSEKMANYDKAIQEYGRVINSHPFLINVPFIYDNKTNANKNKGLAYYNMGLAYRGKSIYMSDRSSASIKYLKQAQESYKKAIKFLKNDFDSNYNLALTDHLLGDYKDAGYYYCKAINLNPENFEAHYNFALLLRSMKMYKESLAEFEKTTMLINPSLQDEKYKYIFGLINEIKRRMISDGEYDYIIKRTDLTSLSDDDIKYSNGKVVLSKQKDFNMKEFMKCTYEKQFKEI